MSLERKVSELDRKVRELMGKKTERTRWEWYEERIPALALKLGAASPTETTRAWSSDTYLDIPVYSYSSTTTQYAEFLWHAPDDLNANHPVYIHVMWAPGASWSSGTYKINIRYLRKTESGTLGADASTLITQTITPSNATNIIETEFPDAIVCNPDELIAFRVIRDTADTGNDVLHLLFIEIEYARWI